MCQERKWSFLLCSNLVLHFLGSTAQSDKKCLESMSTLRYVPSCPRTIEELQKAAQRKQCHDVANTQSCTEPENFKYHCVLNSFKNATVEVCAPEIISQGFCIKFDEGGMQLQQLYNEDCTNFTKPCSTRFSSSDLLHYIQCNDIIKVCPVPIEVTEKPFIQSEEGKLMITIICLLIVVIILLLLTFIHRRSIHNNPRGYHLDSGHDHGVLCTEMSVQNSSVMGSPISGNEFEADLDTPM